MDELQATLAVHGLWVLFALAVVEGPIVVLGATALAQMGTMDIRWVWVIAVMADLFGDVLLYALGRFAPGVLPQRHRPHIAQERAADLFRRSGARLLLVAKLTHFAGLPTLVAAGFARMALVPFLWWSFLGTVVKVSVIVFTGWSLWRSVAAGDASDAVAVLVALALCLALAVLWLRRRRWS